MAAGLLCSNGRAGGGGAIDLVYQAPEECKKDTEKIEISNTCVIDPQSRVTLERGIASTGFNI